MISPVQSTILQLPILFYIATVNQLEEITILSSELPQLRFVLRGELYRINLLNAQYSASYLTHE